MHAVTVGELAEHLKIMRAPQWGAVRHDGNERRYWAGGGSWIPSTITARRYPDTDQLGEALDDACQHQPLMHYEWVDLGVA